MSKEQFSLERFKASEVLMTRTAFAKAYDINALADDDEDNYFVYMDRFWIRQSISDGQYYFNYKGEVLASTFKGKVIEELYNIIYEDKTLVKINEFVDSQLEQIRTKLEIENDIKLEGFNDAKMNFLDWLKQMAQTSIIDKNEQIEED